LLRCAFGWFEKNVAILEVVQMVEKFACEIFALGSVVLKRAYFYYAVTPVFSGFVEQILE
jgi:hypothetical protein